MIGPLDTKSGDIVDSRGRKANYSGLGLAVASLVLGIISIPLSLVLIGGICGLIGLVLAIIHLKKKHVTRRIKTP